jgi:hypothetical protein
MPRSSPYQIVLTDEERRHLEATARSHTSPYWKVVRAWIVLYTAEGLSNGQIAARLDTPRQVVSKWRKRFFEQRLADQPRGGRPPVFSAEVVGAVKALACELRSQRGVALSRWHYGDLARAAVDHNLVGAISDTTIWRWLSAYAIKPRQHRSWIFPRDVDFAAKAARVLDLYARTWQGTPLNADDYVVSADEKISIQTRLRTHERDSLKWPCDTRSHELSGYAEWRFVMSMV